MTLYLIRHGEAAQAWDEAPDPILSANGIVQAQALAEQYYPTATHKEVQLLSSPLARAQQTAMPFQKKLNTSVTINTNFAEIPSPGIALADRRNWLKALFAKNISDFEAPQLVWRTNIIQAVNALKGDTLIFSHFMTINAIVGWINEDDRIVSYYPDYCSMTTIEKIGNNFIIKSLGKELPTVIQ